ncbi:hypothetical protein [Flagellimonas okinawensis]|uniref:Uncharacterized protein n=1 Tax=Flagellimonas okinawensis TaxID=3031324 RepID=A0ABT5XPK4_9FLAO|nr:hypothetical protein [[Muricauda] okinawensis]MDF0707819.1 hypothetical protein [[Muricauda] okinawensis]
MNKHVKNLYVAISDNRVVHASTQLKEFHRTIDGLITDIRSLSYYEKKFKKQSRIEHMDNLGKKYYFEKFI